MGPFTRINGSFADYCAFVMYGSKVSLHLLNIFECKSSACRVDLLICINSSYSLETAAQRKDLPCNAIAQANIVRLDGFFISKLSYFLISLDTRQNARDQTNSCTVHCRKVNVS